MSLRFIACRLLAAVCSVQAGRASSATIDEIDLGDGDTAIIVSGEIRQGDAKRFRSLAGKHEEAIVLLESNGGLTHEAIQIGEAIRLKGFTTSVLNGSDCNSACALVWLAGSPRTISKSAKVGFHATYLEVNGQASESGVGNAIVGRYLTLLNLPERAIIFATSAPPGSLKWLTSQNFAATGIDVTVVDDITSDQPEPKSAKSQESSSNRPIVSTSHWATIGSWSVMVDPTLANGCFLTGTWLDQTKFRIGINNENRDNYYLLLGNPKWTSLRLQAEHRLQFQFDRKEEWDVPLKVVKLKSGLYLLGTFTDLRFWEEFTSSYTLYVRREGRVVTEMSLPGSRLAFDKLIECQKAQPARNSRDPFAE